MQILSEPVNILIYVLDDNDGDLELIGMKFKNEGIANFKLFTSHEEFLSEFSEHVYLTVIDYILGGPTTGLEILREIKSINPFCHNIVLTGYGDWKTVRLFFKNGASDFISKDDSEYLQEIIDSVKYLLPDIAKRKKIFDKWFKEKGDDSSSS